MVEYYLLMLPSSAVRQDIKKAGENSKLTDHRWIHGFVIKDGILYRNSKQSQFSYPNNSMLLSQFKEIRGLDKTCQEILYPNASWNIWMELDPA